MYIAEINSWGKIKYYNKLLTQYKVDIKKTGIVSMKQILNENIKQSRDSIYETNTKRKH